MEDSSPQVLSTLDKNTFRKRRAWAQSRAQRQNVEENITSTACTPDAGLSSVNKAEDNLSIGAKGNTSRRLGQPMLLCISQILEFYKEDPEDILYNLGFGMEEPNITAKIPSRFFSYTSHANGINFRVFLEAQVKRLGEENPSYTLASRFRQIEVLTTMANALTSLYSRVSKTPVAKIGPVHEFSFSPEKSNKWPEGKLAGGKAVQKLRKTITKLCLYGVPKELEKKEFSSKTNFGLDQPQDCAVKTDCVRAESQGSGEVSNQAFSSKDSDRDRSESPRPKKEESQHPNRAMTKEMWNVDTRRSRIYAVNTKAHQFPEMDFPNEHLECSSLVPSLPESEAVSTSDGAKDQHIDTHYVSVAAQNII